MFSMEMHDIDEVDDTLFKYAVIVTKHAGKWTLVRHKERNTWEIPGGHRETGEVIFEAAKRELIEETGATIFDIEKVSAYSVTIDGDKSYGLLCYSEVKEYGEKLMLEIVERREFDELPKELTYPRILPTLFEVVKTYNER